MRFKLMIPFIVLMLICSGIAIADQKVVSSENDFIAGSFSDMQLNLNPTSSSCIYRYISSGYDFYTSGQHGCDGGYECNDTGLCESSIVYLTWSGSTHTEADCINGGGTVFDTGGTGTICQFSRSTCLSGWVQAANWQQYTATTWGGDGCGHYLSTGPDSFSDLASHASQAGAYAGECLCTDCPACDVVCCDATNNKWREATCLTTATGKRNRMWAIDTVDNPATKRDEIGCK